MISFAIRGDHAQPVALKVFDVTGRVVRTLVDRALEPGAHAIAWDGMSDAGIRTSSGVYFYELRTPELVTTGKVVMRK
jgi:flagellar hook assembly protein FlgD